jgi:hypothetical protein
MRDGIHDFRLNVIDKRGAKRNRKVAEVDRNPATTPPNRGGEFRKPAVLQ